MDRYLFRGKRFGVSEVPYGDGWAIGHLTETPKVPGRSGYSIVTLSPAPAQKITSDDVDPATIGQCTDLRDDNNTLIFEGDILRLTNEQDDMFLATVVFGNPNGRYSWGWQLSFHRHMNSYDNDILLWVETELPDMKCEIIGNIHDGVKE